jgi:hypothetical protein
LALNRRAVTGRAPRLTGSGVVRVITTAAPFAMSMASTCCAIASVGTGSYSPVGPVDPAGGWPASTAIVSPASGAWASMTGGRRTRRTNPDAVHIAR